MLGLCQVSPASPVGSEFVFVEGEEDGHAQEAQPCRPLQEAPGARTEGSVAEGESRATLSGDGAGDRLWPPAWEGEASGVQNN